MAKLWPAGHIMSAVSSFTRIHVQHLCLTNPHRNPVSLQAWRAGLGADDGAAARRPAGGGLAPPAPICDLSAVRRAGTGPAAAADDEGPLYDSDSDGAAAPVADDGGGLGAGLEPTDAAGGGVAGLGGFEGGAEWLRAALEQQCAGGGAALTADDLFKAAPPPPPPRRSLPHTHTPPLPPSAPPRKPSLLPSPPSPALAIAPQRRSP